MLNISFFQEKNQLKSKNTLPAPLTPLIGRQEDVIALSTLLQGSQARLVTLWGPGGVGKTRLALEVVAQIADYFPEGVFFIDLAAIREPARLIPAIAATLGAKNNTDPIIQEHLQAYLHGKELLLLLDNFEQLLPAAAVLTELLLANSGLKILVTSRALLNVRGERGFHVLPLTLPESSLQEDPACIIQFAAIQLFVRQAQEVNSHFQITASNASVVAEVCRRLDGLPLAIEQAAAHTKLLSAQQLLKLLQNRLQLLTNGARDLTARQQTLRNTLKWSYDLLTPEEQRIFRQCSIFESACTLEALEAITGETTVTLLERVTALLDKSLLHQSRSANGEPSLRMLGTIREYSREQLLAHEELESVQHTYMNYYQTLALEAEQKLTGPEQGVWLDRLQAEYENLQAVLRLLVEQGEEQGTRALGRVLYLFGYIRGEGRVSEEFSWLERVISCETQTRLSARARSLHCLGASAFFANDLHQARSFLEESLKLYRGMHEPVGEALAICMLGHVNFALQDYSSARAQATQAFTVFKDQTEPIACEQVLSLYERDNHYGDHSTRASSRRTNQLTAREMEILRLVATGITDAQIAQQLIISPRTVSWHLSSIYAKIGVSSRSAATRYAIKRHLCSP